jgi:hypothetical protein
MDERARRLAQNEALYREVNERVSEQAERHDARPKSIYDFICECSDIECTMRLEIPLGEYERVRANPRRFLIAPDHYLPDIETLMERHAGYWIIEKDDEAGEVAERLDPRS